MNELCCIGSRFKLACFLSKKFFFFFSGRHSFEYCISLTFYDYLEKQSVLTVPKAIKWNLTKIY